MIGILPFFLNKVSYLSYLIYFILFYLIYLQKKKKKKSEEPDYETMGAMNVPKNFMPQRASDITDEVIVSRMDDKMLKKVSTYFTYSLP